jgi:DNA modification methylase
MSIEKNKIYQGDCLEVLRAFPDEFIDLTVTSPPYDNLRTYNGYTFDFEGIAKELYRVTKEGGVVVWVVGDATIKGSETGTSFKQALYFKEIGFNLHDTMIYRSGKPPLTHNRYEQEFEYMFILSKGKPKTFNAIRVPCIEAGKSRRRNYGEKIGAKTESKNAIRHRDEITKVSDTKIKYNIWSYPTGMGGTTNDKIAFEHPAIFPEKLAEDHILSWSNEGDTVLDPMCGSGTTLKMALHNNRSYIGIEISEKYCEIARSRLTKHPLF